MQATIERLFNSLGGVFYVRFDAEIFYALNARTLAEFHDKPLVALRGTGKGDRTVVAIGAAADGISEPDIETINPFAHDRLFVQDFEVAQALIRYAITKLRGPVSLVRPRLVIHPARATAGDLTDIEERALLETGFAVGARSVSIHVGQNLGPSDVLALALGASAPAA